MLGSMYSAVSGLAAHQTKMNIIGNNIANVNTYGFKSSRVTFTDVFYQTMNGASAPDANGNGGGSNPTQMGYGTKINSINVINTRAGSATTDRALDVYINGDGYLPVKNADGVIKYTRVGVLNFDQAGNLVDSTGNQVFGFVLDPATNKPALNSNGTAEITGLKGINIAPSVLEKLTGIAIGQNGDITGIQEGDPTVIPSGNTDWMEGIPTISPTSTYTGRLTMSAELKDPLILDVYTITAKTFDKSGAIVENTQDWTYVAGLPNVTNDLNFGDVKITVNVEDFEAAVNPSNLAGFTNVSVGNIGPGAGLPVKLAQIASVKFTNPDGLSQDGQGYFVGTTNSGLPVATIPGSGGTGTFRAGALEMSNVDLSREFTEMIITQRGFQANTRMITVSDEMLSELISMKR